MLRLIERLAGTLLPAPLHRAGLRVAYRIRRTWRRVAKPDLAGVSVILLNDSGEVLLVRHSYGTHNWSVPGGGIGRGEDPQQTARREMREELGVDLADLRQIARREEALSHTRHTAFVFTATAAGEIAPDNREIVAHGFFPLDALPEPMTANARNRLELFRAWRESGSNQTRSS